MTEKRFWFNDANEDKNQSITDRKMLRTYYNKKDICQLLNEQEGKIITLEVKVYQLQEESLMKEDYDLIVKQNTKMEIKLNEQSEIIRTLGIGIAKIKKSIQNNREAHSLILCLEILKKLEENGYLEENLK